MLVLVLGLGLGLGALEPYPYRCSYPYPCTEAYEAHHEAILDGELRDVVVEARGVLELLQLRVGAHGRDALAWLG